MILVRLRPFIDTLLSELYLTKELLKRWVSSFQREPDEDPRPEPSYAANARHKLALLLLNKTDEEIALLKELKLYGLLEGMVTRLEDATISSDDLEDMTAQLAVLTDRLRYVPAVLDFGGIHGIEYTEGEQPLEITFGDSSVSNIVDVKKQFDDWETILRGVLMLHDQAPEAARITAVQKSSPLTLSVAVIAGVVISLGKVAEVILERYKLYLEIKIKVEELKKLKLQNEQIAKTLAEQAEELKKEIAAEAERTIVADQDANGEVKTALSLSINNLFLFFEKGGRIDSPSISSTPEEVKQLYSKVRAIENNVEKLTLPPPQDDDEPDEESSDSEDSSDLDSESSEAGD